MRASLHYMSLILWMPNVGDNQRFGSQYPCWCTSIEHLRSVDRELAKSLSCYATWFHSLCIKPKQFRYSLLCTCFNDWNFQMFTKLFLTSFRCSHVNDEQVILAPCPHASGGELQLLRSFVDIDRSQVFLLMAILSLSLTLQKYNSQILACYKWRKHASYVRWFLVVCNCLLFIGLTSPFCD